MGKLMNTIKKKAGIPEAPKLTPELVLAGILFTLNIISEVKKWREAHPKEETPASPAETVLPAAQESAVPPRSRVQKPKPDVKWFVRRAGDHFSAYRSVTKIR